MGKGKPAVCERLVNMPEARRVCFARKESELEDGLAGWLEVTRNHHKLQTLTTEQKSVEAELEIELARDGTQNALERLLAIKNEIAALERGDDSAA